MTTLKHTGGITGNLLALARIAGALVYTVFRMAAWIVGLGALGFAVLFHVGGVPELIGGALRVAAGSAIIYLAVTQIVKRIVLFAAAPAGDEQGAPHAG